MCDRPRRRFTERCRAQIGRNPLLTAVPGILICEDHLPVTVGGRRCGVEESGQVLPTGGPCVNQNVGFRFPERTIVPPDPTARKYETSSPAILSRCVPDSASPSTPRSVTSDTCSCDYYHAPFGRRAPVPPHPKRPTSVQTMAKEVPAVRLTGRIPGSFRVSATPTNWGCAETQR